MNDRVIDLIREYIPEPIDNKYHSEYILGYNEAIKKIEREF